MSAHPDMVSDLQRSKSEVLKFKVMITEKLQNAINDQLIAEMWSANLYLSMSFYLEKEGYDGLSHWMKKQSQEELEHAYDMASFLQKRGGTAKVSMIDVVPQGWGSVQEVFKHVCGHRPRGEGQTFRGLLHGLYPRAGRGRGYCTLHLRESPESRRGRSRNAGQQARRAQIILTQTVKDNKVPVEPQGFTGTFLFYSIRIKCVILKS